MYVDRSTPGVSGVVASATLKIPNALPLRPQLDGMPGRARYPTNCLDLSGSSLSYGGLFLVGGWGKTPLKNMSASIGMMTFPIYGKRKNGNQTTNQFLYHLVIWKNLQTPPHISYEYVKGCVSEYKIGIFQWPELVNVFITIWKIHSISSWFTYSKCWFSIVM